MSEWDANYSEKTSVDGVEVNLTHRLFWSTPHDIGYVIILESKELGKLGLPTGNDLILQASWKTIGEEVRCLSATSVRGYFPEYSPHLTQVEIRDLMTKEETPISN